MASNSDDHRFLSIDSLKRCYLSRKLYRFTTSTQLKIDPYLPVQLLELVFRHVSSLDDRNALSLVCKSWYEAERFSRQKVVITNCDAIDPERVIARFPGLTSLTVKGRVGHWGNDLCPWIKTMVAGGIDLEELRVKRMVVSEETLTLISRSFPNLKSLVLISCHSISTDGLAAIVSNCRSLTEFDVQSVVIDDNEHWLSCFPDSCTTLVSLNFADLPGKISTEALERLVARCPNLTSLRLNHRVTLDVLLRILVQAPHLVDLGVGSFCGPVHPRRRLSVLQECTSIRSLSGFMSKVDLLLLPAIHPICQSLTSLDLSRSTLLNTDKSLICGRELEELIRHCPKLERLWVQGAAIGDEGLAVVASTCKELQELRILPNFQAFVTEKGLVAVSAGCPKLKSVYYTCKEITNAALITVAKNCPNLTCFMLHDDKNRIAGDIMTMYPLDEGFEAIVQSCKGLKKLRLCGFITDQVFMSIGMYAQQLEKLTIPFAEDSEYGILYVLNGCKKLKELDINNSRFGNKGLLADMSKYETLRSLCMKSCQVTLEGCEQLAQRMPRLNVETNGERKCVYRTLVGPRKDAPPYVRTL